MARYGRKNEMMRPKHLNPDLVTFSMFTGEDVRKLSVCKILTSTVLDALGHPLPGGLYDKAMGELFRRLEIELLSVRFFDGSDMVSGG